MEDAGAGQDKLYPVLDTANVYQPLNKKCLIWVLYKHLRMFHSYTEIMWKQNHTSGVPHIRAVSIDSN